MFLCAHERCTFISLRWSHSRSLLIYWRSWLVEFLLGQLWLWYIQILILSIALNRQALLQIFIFEQTNQVRLQVYKRVKEFFRLRLPGLRINECGLSTKPSLYIFIRIPPLFFAKGGAWIHGLGVGHFSVVLPWSELFRDAHLRFKFSKLFQVVSSLSRYFIVFWNIRG